MKKKVLIEYGIIIFLLIISAGVIFNNLGYSTFFDWDESRHGENSLEILKTNDWIVLNYGGQPDFYNLKPPLGAWLIAFSFSIFGVDEFALRFWSAIFGVGTILLVYLFGSEIKNKCMGIYSAIFLLTIGGFIGYHGARTGDYDVMVTFFITLSLYFFYLSQIREKKIFLIGASISMALAVMVKGVIGLFPAMIILIFLFFFRSLRKTILTRETGYAIFSFSILVFPWFIYRFFKGKDFFSILIGYDLLKRIGEPIEGHVGDWSFYFLVLNQMFGKILFILILVIFVYSIILMSQKNRPVSFLVIWISLVMLIFTVAKTKIFWYIIPLYPAISLLIGYHINNLQQHFKIEKTKFMGMFLIVMIIPFFSILTITQSVVVEPYQMSIKDLKPELSKYNVVYIHSDENRQSGFLYLNSYVKKNVNVYNDIKNISANSGDGIITFNSERYNYLANSKDYELVKSNKFVALFKKI